MTKKNKYPETRKSRVIKDLSDDQISKLLLEATSNGIQKVKRAMSTAKAIESNEYFKLTRCLAELQNIRHKEFSINRELRKADLDIELRERQTAALAEMTDEQINELLEDAVSTLKLVE